jgi:phosphonopyruvate decarboxylase
VITAADFLGPAKALGIDFFTGVPCSFLTPVINRVISADGLDYVAAASEGEAIGIASGAWLAGRKTAVICQNSGLGNMVNPLTSLNQPFRIPTLLITTWRGGPNLKDEPQHEMMGEITPALLDVLKIPHAPFPKSIEDVSPTLSEALSWMEDKGLPYALIMEKGDVADETLATQETLRRAGGTLHDFSDGEKPPSRWDVLEGLINRLPEEACVIATTGKAGRELFTLSDRKQHLYQVGSMGCASAMGLGVSLNVERPVVVVDGDGAALMKMGAFATIGAYAPRNLLHLVLDNETYDSTGGQPTVSPNVDFASVALACGYASAFRADSLEGVAKAIGAVFDAPGPRLVHVKIAPGSKKNLGRPTVKPDVVARRFQSFLLSGD